MARVKKSNLRSLIGPGILVAATGVGAGDLATGAFAGSKLGVAVLWAVIVGAGLKFVLTEGLARWQLATGETLLEGCVERFGPLVQYLFLVFLLFWSFFVGSALMSACGVAAHAIAPLVSPETDKIIYGLLHSAVAVLMVRRGGYRLFEKVMSVCIAVMFVTVVSTAVMVQPSWTQVVSGLLVPKIPEIHGDGLQWTIALMGGVGGTLTILCYGYWIREEGRGGPEDLRICRIDLATGYVMTALFGMGMVVLGSRVDVQGRGATLVVALANQLESELGAIGPVARWAFLLGAWGAVASSLLGVWQSVPYLFADFRSLSKSRGAATRETQNLTATQAYRRFLYGLATIPAIGLFFNFREVQKWYAIVGASFMPLLAVVLLVLNGRSEYVGEKCRNSVLTTLLLVATALMFFVAGYFEVRKRLGL